MNSFRTFRYLDERGLRKWKKTLLILAIFGMGLCVSFLGIFPSDTIIIVLVAIFYEGFLFGYSNLFALIFIKKIILSGDKVIFDNVARLHSEITLRYKRDVNILSAQFMHIEAGNDSTKIQLYILFPTYSSWKTQAMFGESIHTWVLFYSDG